MIQQRGDPISTELETLLAKDAVLQGRYSDALETASNSGNTKDTSTIVVFAAKHLITHGSDTDIAKLALRVGRNHLGKHLKPETTSAIEERLRSAGLDELATTFSGRSVALGTVKPAISGDSFDGSSSPAPLQPLGAEPPSLGTAKTILSASKDTRLQIIGMLDHQSDLSAQN